eukprot:TRINITY_DN6246_c1_g1_i1.p5 TRINITY_DN6246_c1_g1~~TRINITY_DN6246_c1_g1_i1.p5  ORF type:complete len:118 (-),score=22.71 TRINITY_DN6246_c1_g1_i1:634-987(-)
MYTPTVMPIRRAMRNTTSHTMNKLLLAHLIFGITYVILIALLIGITVGVYIPEKDKIDSYIPPINCTVSKFSEGVAANLYFDVELMYYPAITEVCMHEGEQDHHHHRRRRRGCCRWV